MLNYLFTNNTPPCGLSPLSLIVTYPQVSHTGHAEVVYDIVQGMQHKTIVVAELMVERFRQDIEAAAVEGEDGRAGIVLVIVAMAGECLARGNAIL